MTKAILAVIGALVVITSALAAQPTQVNLRAIDLGTANYLNLSGAEVMSSAHQINNFGQITAVVGPTGSGRNRGFVWQPDGAGAVSGTMVDLQQLFGFPQYTTAFPSINEEGQILSGLRFVPSAPNALIGTASSSPSSRLPNRAGQFAFQTSDNRAARLDPPSPANPTGVVPIGPVDPNEESSAGVAINEFGQVGVVASGPGLAHTAYLWTPSVVGGTNGTTTRIDVPAIGSRSGFENYLMNDRGQLLLVEFDHGSFRARSDLWTPLVENGTTGSLSSLSDLVGGQNTFALDLNNRGEALFSSYDDSGGSTKYFWSSADFGLVNLSDLAFQDTDPLRDLARFIPGAMNDRGQFVGTGVWRRAGFPDEHRATLVYVPEPAAILGPTALLVIRRKRH